jgi:hypothetical protein
MVMEGREIGVVAHQPLNQSTTECVSFLATGREGSSSKDVGEGPSFRLSAHVAGWRAIKNIGQKAWLRTVGNSGGSNLSSSGPDGRHRPQVRGRCSQLERHQKPEQSNIGQRPGEGTAGDG